MLASATTIACDKITSVQLSYQVLLKIIQHARDMSPSLVTGQLLGMEKGPVLEITDCFQFVASISDDVEEENYQIEMLKALRDVNVDHNTIGWYQTCSYESYINAVFVDTQTSYQTTISNSIAVVYDHDLSANGPPHLRALRLRTKALSLLQDNKGKTPSSLLSGDLFEEIPLEISLSCLDELLLTQLSSTMAIPSPSLTESPATQKTVMKDLVEMLLDGIDENLAESGRILHYYRSLAKQNQFLASQRQKRRQENAARIQSGESPLPEDDVVANLKHIHEPSRLGLLYSTAQLDKLVELTLQMKRLLSAKALVPSPGRIW